MEREEFAEFYAGSFARLVGQLYAVTGDQGEAQDAVQEAFVRAWARHGKLDRTQAPEAWVRVTAWRIAVSRWSGPGTAPGSGRWPPDPRLSLGPPRTGSRSARPCVRSAPPRPPSYAARRPPTLCSPWATDPNAPHLSNPTHPSHPSDLQHPPRHSGRCATAIALPAPMSHPPPERGAKAANVAGSAPGRAGTGVSSRWHGARGRRCQRARCPALGRQLLQMLLVQMWHRPQPPPVSCWRPCRAGLPGHRPRGP